MGLQAFKGYIYGLRMDLIGLFGGWDVLEEGFFWFLTALPHPHFSPLL
jgi:hypothetical protein